MFGNPRAIEEQVRFIDEDLNRLFHVDELNSKASDSWEAQRAHELNELLGPKFNNPGVDVLIDLHTTTSNMGNTIIIYPNPFNLKMAKYIQDHKENVRIYVSDKEPQDTVGLQSLAPQGMSIEVGPIPQGVLFHKQFEDMAEIAYLGLDFIRDYYNSADYDVTGTDRNLLSGLSLTVPSINDQTCLMYNSMRSKEEFQGWSGLCRGSYTLNPYDTIYPIIKVV